MYIKIKYLLLFLELSFNIHVKRLSAIEITQNCICLGNEIDVNGTCGNEIRRRMAMTRTAVNRLYNRVFKTHCYSVSHVTPFLDTCDVCNCFIGTESQTSTEELRISYKNKTSNHKLGKEQRRHCLVTGFDKYV